MNSINLIGNICNDLELKATPNGKYVCSFNVAVRRPFSKDITDFIPVICWDKQAETISKYAHKGTKVGITGMLTTRKYQDKNGNNRTAYDVVANNVLFLDSKRSENANESNSSSMGEKDPMQELQDKLGEFEELSDTDLPF
jgi:single-strand DNA-binding protein